MTHAAFHHGLLGVGILLLISSVFPGRTTGGMGERLAESEAAIKEAQIERSLRRAADRERAQRDVTELDALRLEGERLRASYKPRRTQRVTGSIGLALSGDAQPYDGFEFDEWSGRVITKLKGMRPKMLADHVMDCSAIRPPLERMDCYLERLKMIIGKIQ